MARDYQLEERVTTLIQQGNYSYISKICSEALSRDAENTSAVFFLGYSYCMSKNQIVKGFDLIKHALSIEPNEYDFHYYTALAYHKNEENSRALAHTDIALKIEPGNFSACVLKGEIYLEMGLLESALRIAKSLQQEYPASTSVKYIIGTYHNRKGDNRTARKIALEILAHNPENNSGKVLLANSTNLASVFRRNRLMKSIVHENPDNENNISVLKQSYIHRYIFPVIFRSKFFQYLFIYANLGLSMATIHFMEKTEKLKKMVNFIHTEGISPFFLKSFLLLDTLLLGPVLLEYIFIYLLPKNIIRGYSVSSRISHIIISVCWHLLLFLSILCIFIPTYQLAGIAICLAVFLPLFSIIFINGITKFSMNVTALFIVYYLLVFGFGVKGGIAPLYAWTHLFFTFLIFGGLYKTYNNYH